MICPIVMLGICIQTVNLNYSMVNQEYVPFFGFHSGISAGNASEYLREVNHESYLFLAELDNAQSEWHSHGLFPYVKDVYFFRNLNTGCDCVAWADTDHTIYVNALATRPGSRDVNRMWGKIFIHEMGHLLGIPHTHNRKDVMNISPALDSEISQADMDIARDGGRPKEIWTEEWLSQDASNWRTLARRDESMWIDIHPIIYRGRQ